MANIKRLNLPFWFAHTVDKPDARNNVMRDRIAEHLADIDRAVKRHGSLTFSRN